MVLRLEPIRLQSKRPKNLLACPMYKVESCKESLETKKLLMCFQMNFSITRSVVWRHLPQSRELEIVAFHLICKTTTLILDINSSRQLGGHCFSKNCHVKTSMASMSSFPAKCWVCWRLKMLNSLSTFRGSPRNIPCGGLFTHMKNVWSPPSSHLPSLT